MPVDSREGHSGQPPSAASGVSAQSGAAYGSVKPSGTLSASPSPSPSPSPEPLVSAHAPTHSAGGSDPAAGPHGSVQPMLQAPLSGRVTADATAHQIADAVLAVWADIEATLHPIVGHRGVAAMFHRSLSLAGSGHAWLHLIKPDGLAAVDTQALHAALAQQTPADASTGATALLQTFYNLLASLVGSALTARLLADVWAGAAPLPPSTPSAQDTLR